MFLSKVIALFLLATISVSFAGIIAPGIPAILRGVRIKTAHGKYIRAYPGEYGRVDQSDTAGDWETFTVMYAPGNSHDTWITTFHGTNLGVDEHGNVHAGGSGGHRKFERIYSGGKMAFKTAYGKYLCAEEGHNGLIKGDRTVINDWELFQV